MQTRKLLMLAAVAGGLSFTASAAATYTTYSWVGGSGDYTTASQWNPSIENGPGSGYPDSNVNTNQTAKFPRYDGDQTVTLPQGLVTNVATPQFYAQPGHTLTIDGSQGITLDGANGCAVEGKVVFDFDNGGRGYPPSEASCEAGAMRGATALPVGTQLTVANWTGTKPDTTYWRSKNVGTKLICRYVANDGTIVATVRPTPGMMVILR